MIKHCLICNKSIEVIPALKLRKKFCSKLCKHAYFKGKHLSPESEFKKGRKVYFSKTHRINLSKAKRGKSNPNGSGKRNGKWLGNEVGYSALHSWVKRKLGKASVCSQCGSTKKVQWANKSHEYKRILSDWIQLCYWCHRKYDRKKGWGDATRLYPEIA